MTCTSADIPGRRLVESAVGAHLLNSARGTAIEVFYWRERSREVDFVLRAGQEITALEVKSGHPKESLSGMEAFTRAFEVQHQLLVGGQGIGLEAFLERPATHWAGL